MCSFVTQRHRCLKLRDHAICMLTAGMSTRAVAKKCNVNFSTISHLIYLENLAVLPTGLTTADHL